MKTLTFSILFVSLLSIKNVHAYLYPSFFIIRNLAQKHARFHQMQIKSKVSFFKEGQFLGKLVEQVRFYSPRHVSIALYPENSTINAPIAAVSRDLSKSHPIAYDFLFIQEEAALFERFRKLGLPLIQEADHDQQIEPTISLMPVDNQIVVAHGRAIAKTEAVDARAPIFYYEKNSYLPIRAIFPETTQGQRLELRWSGYRPYESFFYPRTMEVRIDAQLVLRIEAISVQTKPENMKELKTSSTNVTSATELQSSIQTYFKWVR